MMYNIITAMNSSGFDSRFKSNKPHFPFIVEIYDINHTNLKLGQWLLYNIGENHKCWEWWWIAGYYKFEFKTEENKVKFILRWL